MVNRKLRTVKITAAIACLILLSGFGQIAVAQDCDSASNNPLCTSVPSQSTTTPNSPFDYGCMDVSQSSFYTFQTNSVASSGTLAISITNKNCSDFLGNDTLYVMVIQLANGSDPCDVSAYSNPTCFEDDSGNFSAQLSSLLNSQEYLLVVGSNHDPDYGDCQFEVELSGDAISLVVGVNPLRVNLGDPAQLTVTGHNADSDLTWEPPQFLDDPTSDSPLAYAENTTTFTVTGQVGDCEVTQMITVTVAPPLEIYNTFTPNGDGINDTWKIGRIEKFPNCQVQVFDRWGQMVFKSIGYTQPWDGTNKGKSLPMAAYYYVIELNSMNVESPPITGTISIMR